MVRVSVVFLHRTCDSLSFLLPRPDDEDDCSSDASIGCAKIDQFFASPAKKNTRHRFFEERGLTKMNEMFS